MGTVLLPERTLFFSSFCFCLSSRADRRFSALIRCSSSFLRRPSSCCSLSCRAFSSFSSHWVFLAAKIGQKNHGDEGEILPKEHWTKESALSPLSFQNTVGTLCMTFISMGLKALCDICWDTSFDRLGYVRKTSCLKLEGNIPKKSSLWC